MSKIIFKCLSLVLFLFLFKANAQTEQPEPSLTDSNLEGQFEFIYDKSSNYQEYKVVKRVWLDQLRKNILDSVASVEEDLVASQKLTETQSNEISTLKSSLEEVNNNLTGVSAEKDSITFLGVQIEKSAYKTIMWSIVLLLALIILFLAYKFKNANTITREAKKTLVEVEEEYEDYRRKALEREQKVRRQLQDEINKQKIAKPK